MEKVDNIQQQMVMQGEKNRNPKKELKRNSQIQKH